MSLNEQDISRIIARVRQEIGAREDKRENRPDNAGAVVLVPSFVPSPEKAMAALAEHYGQDAELVFLSSVVFELSGVQSRRLDWKTQPNELVGLLVTAQTLVLLAPGTGLLRRIGNGRDEDGVGELLLRRLLWGKPFDVLIDFLPPKFRRGTYYADIAESIDALSSMGVRFHTYQPADGPAQDAYALITEQDIIEAKRDGRKSITCAKGAIITPLAADAAKELQINIDYA